ncbi:MAG: hypothetical protein JSS78_05060 [Bacteroidetes bacterium]|nr:hypothetical protein [Bacteroidota bacterium]
MASSLFTDETTDDLKQLYLPPLSYKSWMNGISPENDLYKRFEGHNATPPKMKVNLAFLRTS